MAKRRDQVAMTDAERRDFIASQKTVQVATINRDGTPHLVPLWFAIVDDEIVLETFTKSQKVVNLKRDPRFTLLLESGRAYEELRGLSIYARAELVQDVDRVHELHMAVLKRNTELSDDLIEQVSKGMAHKKAAIIAKVERSFSWDHSKLGGVY